MFFKFSAKQKCDWQVFLLNIVKRINRNSRKISSHETPLWEGPRYKTFCDYSARLLVKKKYSVASPFYWMWTGHMTPTCKCEKKVLQWHFCDIRLLRLSDTIGTIFERSANSNGNGNAARATRVGLVVQENPTVDNPTPVNSLLLCNVFRHAESLHGPVLALS